MPDVLEFRLTPPHPSIILTAPAFFRHAYGRPWTVSRNNAKDPQNFYKVMRILQRNETFHWFVGSEETQRMLASEEAMSIIQVRQDAERPLIKHSATPHPTRRMECPLGIRGSRLRNT